MADPHGFTRLADWEPDMIEDIAYYFSPYFVFYMLDLILDFVVLLINTGFNAIDTFI